MVRGRGAASNPANRFLEIALEADEEAAAETGADETPAPATRVYRDLSRSVISTNDSPDVGFEASINPYRGCEHGCAYCYARPTHEYLGWSAGLDFETRIMAKTEAPVLLRKALASPRWTPKVIAMSGVTDPYQPVEKRLGITRGCLEVLAEFRNPVAIITKNHLVTRDADLLAGMSAWNGAAVCLSVTTLDAHLAAALEPRASSPRRRLAAIEALAAAGVPVGVNVAPVVPGLTDHEVPAILRAAARAGARFAGWGMLRLPHGVKDIFADWLDRHAPRKKEKVLALVRSVRGGALNDSRWGERMRGEGAYADQIARLFEIAARKAGMGPWPDLSTAAFSRSADGRPLALSPEAG